MTTQETATRLHLTRRFATLVTLRFREAGPGATELELTHERFPAAEVRDHHEQGWHALLARLEPALQKEVGAASGGSRGA